jgi:PKHD-type hydroxylase
MFLNRGSLKSPWVQWEKAFSEDEIKSIKELKKLYKPEEGLVYSEGELVNVTDIRKSKTFFVNRSETVSWIFDSIEKKVVSVNRDFFNFDLYSTDSFQYTQYDGSEKGFYGWHWDIHSGGEFEPQRKISLVLQLSDPSEYEGGDLYVNTCGNICKIPKEKGFLAFFPSWVVHQVTPVTKGLRETLVFWITGPDWR